MLSKLCANELCLEHNDGVQVLYLYLLNGEKQMNWFFLKENKFGFQVMGLESTEKTEVTKKNL